MRDTFSRLGSLLFAACAVAGMFVFGQPGESQAGVSSTACGLFESAGATGITVTNAATYYQWVNSSAGVAQGDCTNSTANDNITLNRAGVWRLTLSSSFTNANNSKVIKWAIFANGAAITSTNCEFQRKIGTGGDVGSSSVTCLYTATTGTTIDARVTSDFSGDVVTPSSLNLNAQLVN